MPRAVRSRYSEEAQLAILGILLSTPLLSVIIPTYNRAKYVRRSVESVLRGSGEETEIVVVVDGSTDDTVAALSALPSRVAILRKVNGGLASARNHGVAHSRAPFVAFLDDDDEWIENAPIRMLSKLIERPTWNWVAADAESVLPDGTSTRLTQARTGVSDLQFLGDRLDSEDGVYISADRLYPALVRRNLFTVGAWIMRRSTLQAIGGFDVRLRRAEDWHFYLRAALTNGIAFLSGDPVVRIRGHTGQMSLSAINMRRGFADALALVYRESKLTGDHAQITREYLERESFGLRYEGFWNLGDSDARLLAREHLKRCGLSFRGIVYASLTSLPTIVKRRLRELRSHTPR